MRLIANNLLFILLFTANISAQVGGIVFQDISLNETNLNTYGLKDANDNGAEELFFILVYRCNRYLCQ